MEKVKSVRLELPNGEFSDAMPFAVDGSNIEIDDKTLGELLNSKVNKNGDEMTGNLAVPSLTVGTRMTDSSVGQNSFAQGTAVNASGNDSHAEGYSTVAQKSGSHAEGQYTEAQGEASHAEGYHSIASGGSSHAEGNYTRASGHHAHAEGTSSRASGSDSHAEGWSTIASGATSHAEGYKTTADGANAHAEGYGAIASGHESHAEGTNTQAKGKSQHVQGRNNIVDNSNKYAHIVGNGTAENTRSNAHTLTWDGTAWFQGDVYVGSENGVDRDAGSKKLATEDYITNYLDQKQDKLTAGANITIENNVINAVIDSGDTDIRNYENLLNRPAINGVILSGDQTGNTLGLVSKTGDVMTGPLTTTALTVGSRASGSAIGANSVAEGKNTQATGPNSHSEGQDTYAYGELSHAEGLNTYANRKSQHVEGEYNIPDTTGTDFFSKGKYIHIVGNGTGTNTRSNAHTLDWNGEAWFQGDVYTGSTSGNNKDEGSYKLESQKNKITTLTKNATDEQYPSAKAVNNMVNDVIEGKNLLKLNNGSYTSHGITSVVTNNCEVTYNGTADTNWADFVAYHSFTLEPNETYTFSIDTPRTNGERINLYLRGGDQEQQISINPGETSKTFVANGTTTTLHIGLSLLTADATYNGTVKLQLEKGLTTTGYESYTGGVVFENELEKTLNGKNLLKLANGTATRTGMSLSIIDDLINFKITAGTTSEMFGTFGIDNTLTNRVTGYPNSLTWGGTTLPAGTYTLSSIYVSGFTTTGPQSGAGGNFIKVEIYDFDNKKALADVFITSQSKNTKATFTINTETKINVCVQFYVNTGTVPSANINFKVQLEEGTEATVYTEYTGGVAYQKDIEAVLSEIPHNIIDFTQIITTLTDANTLTNTGIYAICFTHNSENSHLPTSSWGILYTYNKDVTGTAFQIYIPDGEVSAIYKRRFDSSTDTFGEWIQLSPPISHASSETIYGVGTTTNYGHCKILNDLTHSSYANGEALSASQGYILNQKKENLSNKVTSISAASTDTQYASAKAIYNFVPNITYGETDLSSSASLAAGAIYLVYE